MEGRKLGQPAVRQFHNLQVGAEHFEARTFYEDAFPHNQKLDNIRQLRQPIFQPTGNNSDLIDGAAIPGLDFLLNLLLGPIAEGEVGLLNVNPGQLHA